MKLFKRKELLPQGRDQDALRQARALRQAQEERPTLNDKVAKGIAGFILKMQKSFAAFMSKQAGRISASSLKFLLVIFFLSGTGLSVYCVVEAFSKKKNAAFPKPGRVQVPKYYDRNGDGNVHTNSFISKQQYEEMLAFQRYMDSLQQTNLGSYDSIMRSRPGLADSVRQLEQIYEQQNVSK